MDSSAQPKIPRRVRSSVAATAPIAPSEFTYEAAPVPQVALWKRMLQRLMRFVRRNLVTVVPFVILLAALGYYYYQYQHIAAKNDSAAQSKAQVQKAVADVEKVMYIKDDSAAQLATITDTTKLAGQKFFVNAQNGDELVLFPSTQQAVLYRPSLGKIIAVGPYTPQATPAAGTTSASPFRAAAAIATSTKKK